MKIGIDLDGVVFDSDRMFCAYAELFDIEHNGKGKQIEHRYLERAYGWSDELFYEFMSKYLDHILNDAPLMLLAREVLTLLKEEGHELCVITNRGILGEKEQAMTKERFEKEGLSFDKIVFRKGNKAPICQEEKIDVMIDNTPDVITDLMENNINCIYFRDNTREINHPNVKTAKNWAEVYRTIKKMA